MRKESTMKTVTVKQFKKFRPYAAKAAAMDATREHEVEMLRELLEEGGKQ